MSELSVCRQCRREGIKLFLKGDRCFTDKCGVERRTYAPGQHGQASKKLSDYGLQLREKQKVKRIYGIKEKQFRKIFAEAERLKGITGDNLLLLLEKRLDNVIYRIGFARSRAEARKLVKQGHVLVNEERVNIPSYLVKPNDEVSLKFKNTGQKGVKENIEASQSRTVPVWLNADHDHFKGKVLRLPEREDISFTVNEQLIVELYSR